MIDFKATDFPLYLFSDLFRLCPPSLVGAYYLHPPDARAIFLHDDLLCNGTCSVTGGSITYWGGTNGKDPFFLDNNCCLLRFQAIVERLHKKPQTYLTLSCCAIALVYADILNQSIRLHQLVKSVNLLFRLCKDTIHWLAVQSHQQRICREKQAWLRAPAKCLAILLEW